MKPKTKSIMWTITLALVLSLATAYPCAAGTVTNKSAAQRGRSPIYHFDVVAYNGKVAGKEPLTRQTRSCRATSSSRAD